MHEAYEVSHLLTATVQIETMVAYENNLLLGTRQGHLLMYSLSPTNGNQKYEVQILRFCKNFSKKPIQQIEVIPEDNLLLCLTDNVLSSYDINGLNFPLIKTYAQTKGATLFALETLKTQNTTGDAAYLLKLCVAVKRKIQVYCGKNGEFKQHLYDISVPDVPRVICWGLQYLCVGFKAEYTFYDLSNSKPKELFPTSSPLEPTVAKYSDTCFLMGRDHTTVLVDEAKDMQDQEHSPIKWSEPPVAVVWDEPYILGLLQDQIVVQTVEPTLFVQTLSELNKARLFYRCKQGLVLVASMGQVWCVSAVEVTRQRQVLLRDKHYQLAIKLTNISEEPEDVKKQKVHSIHMMHAMDLFDSKKYSESMSEFVKLETDPAEVIRLFPGLSSQKSAESESKAKDLKGKDLESALQALIKYLTEIRPKLLKTTEDERKVPESAKTPLETPKSIDVVKSPTTEKETPKQKNISQLLELIDTTLLKCYLQTNDALIASLLRLNNCKVEEVEQTLLQHGKHSELIILYQTNGQHTKALQLLRDQAKEPDSSLRGYHRTKQYLQNLGAEHIHLIFQFSDWLLKEHPEEGLKIFTDDIEEVENLPRPKVLDFLLREHESLVIPYLEHVIHSWNDTNPLFHNALVRMYRERITDKKTVITEEEIQHIKSKLLQFLQESSHYTPEMVLLHFPVDSLFEERAVILGKLGQHEQALLIYVQILGDVERAIEYCETVSTRSDEKSQDVYVTLMRILLNPAQGTTLTGPLAGVTRHPRSSVPDLETALSILQKHPDKISPLKALAVLPDSVPLSRLKVFLQHALDSQLTRKRRTQTLKGLLLAEHQQVQELQMYHLSQSVVMDQCKLCLVCRKPFVNQSAFVRYPNGDIVHYSCRQDK